MKNIFLLLFLLCLSLLSAQSGTDLKEWQSVSCEFPSDIDWEWIIWGMETGDSRYILCKTSGSNGLFQFKANGDNATCTLTDKKVEHCALEENPYLKNDTTAYDQYDANSLAECDLQSGNYIRYYITGEIKINISNSNCQCFLMESEHYCLHYYDKKLYRFTLNDTQESMSYKELPLDNAPINVYKYSANVVVLNNKCYYLSEAGFCEVTVSGDTTASKIILEVDSIDDTIKNSTLVTDKENRVWIINDTHGVQEYNSETGLIQKIAVAPQIGERLNCYQVCFHLNNYLYYIKNGKVLYLGLKEDPDNPDDPDNPTKSHDQSGHTCGLLGFEFFAVLLGISIIRIYRHK